MRVTKHYEHDRVILYVEEGDTQTCITLESDRQVQRLGEQDAADDNTQTGGNTNNPPSGDLEP